MTKEQQIAADLNAFELCPAKPTKPVDDVREVMPDE